jgi:hypothetical protein
MTLTSTHGELRVAFYGRVACDTDRTAMTTIARQYEQCRHALPPGAITAIFYDIGSHPAVRRRPGQLTVGDQNLHRGGGLDDLLAQAEGRPRRFDQLITYGPDRLSRDMRRAWELMHRLTLVDVECLFPFGDTVESARPNLTIMRLVAAACTAMWSRAAEDGDPR